MHGEPEIAKIDRDQSSHPQHTRTPRNKKRVRSEHFSDIIIIFLLLLNSHKKLESGISFLLSLLFFCKKKLFRQEKILCHHSKFPFIFNIDWGIFSHAYCSANLLLIFILLPLITRLITIFSSMTMRATFLFFSGYFCGVENFQPEKIAKRARFFKLFSASARSRRDLPTNWALLRFFTSRSLSDRTKVWFSLLAALFSLLFLRK